MQLELSPEDIANLILQRTTTFMRLGGGAAMSHWVNTGEKEPLARFLVEQGRVNEFVAAVIAEIAAEFQPLRSFITALRPAAVASIGPGFGMFEHLVYQLTSARLLLIDIEQSAEHQHNFAARGSGYSSLASCSRFLAAMGVPEARVVLCNPRREPLPAEAFDLLLSLYSMGFHYPCDEYAAFIRDQLRGGGLLIFDKRVGAADAGWDALAPLFDVVAEMPAPKATRLVLRKK